MNQKIYIPVHTLLHIDLEECENNHIERYMRWCENLQNTKGVSVQSIMANTAIYNYYLAQHKEVEHQFISSASLIHGKVSVSAMRKLYAEIMIELFKAYPSALLEAAKNLKIENPPYANN